MPRQNRRRASDQPRPLSASSSRLESWRGEDFVVRTVAAAAASKPYRCPGCDHVIAAGSPHVVAWPADAGDAGDRRHWHSACWAARDSRTPTVRRSRTAPRY